MINVCFAGVTGWTAPPIVHGIGAADDLVLTAGVSRSAAGQSLNVVGAPGTGIVHASVPEALAAADVDVLVDYTSATAVRDNVLAAIDAGVHVVVGSSGLTADDYVELDRRARRQGVGVFAGNFSIMAAVLQRVAQLAAQHLDSWEILDYASDTKADVPSGTARELAETLGQVREPRTGVPTPGPAGPVEARVAEVADRASVRRPASWSAPRSSSAVRVSASSCATTRGRAPTPTSRARCWRSRSPMCPVCDAVWPRSCSASGRALPRARRRGRGRGGLLVRRQRAPAGRLGRGRRQPVDPVPRRHLGRHDVPGQPPAAGRAASRTAPCVDFNRAINMPCAYTDFATCPVPPAANTLPFAVEAGEQTPTMSLPGLRSGRDSDATCAARPLRREPAGRARAANDLVGAHTSSAP